MNGEAQKLTWFNDENVTLEVPFFQRPYVWDEGNWQALLDNIEKSFDGRMPFIGSFIFQKPAKDDKRLLVIDGQQRLTTLSVLIKAFLDIYDTLKRTKKKSAYHYKHIIESNGDEL